MKKLILFLFATIFIFSCSKAPQATDATAKTDSISYVGVKEKSFDELFKAIEPEQIPEDIFTLVGKNNTVITAGRLNDFNSMVAGDGGIGILMGKPVTFCGLRGIRYTLEVILRDSVYTMTYFDERFRDDFMLFGAKSGRDSDKMKTTNLTAVETPSGKVAFKEAFLIIECQLAETHTINPKEIYAEKNKKFYDDAFKDVGSYHKIVFGDITNVWVRK